MQINKALTQELGFGCCDYSCLDVSAPIALSLDRLFAGIQGNISSSSEQLNRGRFVIEHRAGVLTRSLTLEHIGDTLGITRERVRQIETKYGRIISRQSWWFKTELPKAVIEELLRKDSIVIRKRASAIPELDGYLAILQFGQIKPSVVENDLVSILSLPPWRPHYVVKAFADAIAELWKSGFETAISTLQACIPPELADGHRGRYIKSRFNKWLQNAELNYLGLSRRDEICRRALLELGGTQHFSQIAARAALIEHVDLTPVYIHNIHASLGRDFDNVIRPGGNGMFARRGSAADTGLQLKDLMQLILKDADEWLSCEEILSRMPQGSRYQLASIALTSQYFPDTFKLSALYGLVQLVSRDRIHLPQAVVDAVEEALRVNGHMSRTLLHSTISQPSYQIDAVLCLHPRIAAIGATKLLRFVLLDEITPSKRLTTAEFADLISNNTGLLSAPALSRHIELHYGWAPSSGSIGG